MEWCQQHSAQTTTTILEQSSVDSSDSLEILKSTDFPRTPTNDSFLPDTEFQITGRSLLVTFLQPFLHISFRPSDGSKIQQLTSDLNCKSFKILNYDSVPREKVWECLERGGISPRLMTATKVMNKEPFL